MGKQAKAPKNAAPILEGGQEFFIGEDGLWVGETTVAASDPNGDTLTYSLDDPTGLFGIDANTGALYLLAPSSFDYESGLTDYTVTVTVSESGKKPKTAEADVTINLLDVNEAPTVDAGLAFAADENTTGTIGTVTATDPDTGAGFGDIASYAIVGGTAGFENFSIAADGTLSLDAPLDYETLSSVDLQIVATDGGGLQSAVESVSITLNDVNEAPTVDAGQGFVVDENSTGTIGTVTVSDPDTGAGFGDIVDFAIVGGSAGWGDFYIQADGTLGVYSALDYETTPSVTLDIVATDGGGLQSAMQTVGVTVNDIYEPAPDQPAVITEAFYRVFTQDEFIEENTVYTGEVVSTLAIDDPDAPDGAIFSIGDVQFGDLTLSFELLSDGVFNIIANGSVDAEALLADGLYTDDTSEYHYEGVPDALPGAGGDTEPEPVVESFLNLLPVGIDVEITQIDPLTGEQTIDVDELIVPIHDLDEFAPDMELWVWDEEYINPSFVEEGSSFSFAYDPGETIPMLDFVMIGDQDAYWSFIQSLGIPLDAHSYTVTLDSPIETMYFADWFQNGTNDYGEPAAWVDYEADGLGPRTETFSFDVTEEDSTTTWQYFYTVELV